VIREDDRESVVRERLEAYEKQTRPLIEFFRSIGRRLYEVDASEGTPETVFGKILEFLEQSGSAAGPKE
jgi:adenylate kinase